jgi:tetratricopeptide (TPR) repeat protein
LGQTENIASALIFLGYMAQHVGDFDEARDRLNEGITYFRELGDRGGVALGLLGLGELALRTGDYETGATRLEEGVALFTSLEDSRGVAAARATLGATRLRQGNLTEARDLLRQSLEARNNLGDQGGIAWCLERIAQLVLVEGDSAENAMSAARLLGAAREIRTRINAVIDPVDRPWVDSVIASCHARLSEFAFSAAWEAGRLMTLEQAIDEAVHVSEST